MNQTNSSILLVEDDLLTQRTSKKLLSRFGEVLTVSNYDDAMAQMRTKVFDVAFFI